MLQDRFLYPQPLAKMQRLARPAQERGREIGSVPGDHARPSLQHILTASADDLRGGPRSGQPSELLGANGNHDHIAGLALRMGNRVRL